MGGEKSFPGEGMFPVTLVVTLVVTLLEAHPEAVFDVGTRGTSPLELALIYNKPTAELFKKYAFECCGRDFLREKNFFVL